MALAKMRIRVIEFPFKPTVKASPKALANAMTKVAREMQREVREVISTPYPPASQPGQPPHLRSGKLKSRTTVKAEGRTIKVRTPQYGIWLEGGTSRMAMRPFIRPTLHGQRRRWGKRITELAKKEMAKTAKKKRRR